MRLNDLKQLTKEELLKVLADTRAELFHHHVRLKAGELKNFAVVGTLKKTIARIQTLLKNK